MKMRWLGLVLICVFLTACETGDSTGYDKDIAEKQGLTDSYESFKKVYAVRFGNSHEEGQFYEEAFKNDDWIPTIEKKVELNRAQIRVVQSIISNSSIQSNESSKCEFLPHHSVVFFGKGGEYLGEITLCFKCQQYLTPTMVYEEDMSRESSDKLKALFKTVGFEIMD